MVKSSATKTQLLGVIFMVWILTFACFLNRHFYNVKFPPIFQEMQVPEHCFYAHFK